MPIKKIDDTCRTVSAKRRVTAATNAVHPHHYAKLFFVLAAVMVAAIGVPVMLWAQTKAQMPARVSVDAASMQNVQAKLSELQQAFSQLMRSQQGMEPGMSIVAKPDDGRADCLNDCRKELKMCKEGYQGEVAEGALHPCLTEANACISGCNDVPRSPISCQDRCAVALGGCIELVITPTAVIMTDENGALTDCQKANQACLINACKLQDGSALPESYCHDQCRRMHVICSTGSVQYDTYGMDLCDRLEETCKMRLCSPALKENESETGMTGERIQLFQNDGLRPYLADAEGRALYFYVKDSLNTSACEGECVNKWPVFADQINSVGDGLQSEDFGTFVRADGKPQTTYKGHPVYYFAQDMKPMDVKGHGVNGVWFLAMPDDMTFSKAECASNCDAFFEDCKRTDVAPFVCQQNTEQCKTECEAKYSE